MSLEQLMYASRQVGTDEAALSAILESARRHNEKTGITGMLFYRDGRFLQVLEGESDLVMATYERIVKDARHNELVLLLRDEIEQRDFKDWSMGLRKVLDTDLEKCPQYSSFFTVAPQGENIVARPGIALEMFKAFSH